MSVFLTPCHFRIFTFLIPLGYEKTIIHTTIGSSWFFGQENYSLNFDNTDFIDLGNYPILTQPQQASFLVRVKMNQLTGHQDNHTVFLKTSLGGMIHFGYDEEYQSFYLAVFIYGDTW